MNASSGLLACWKILLAALRDPRLTPGACACLAMILDRLNDAGTAWPSINTVARDAGVDRATAVRSIKLLVDLGYLERDSGNRTSSNRYRIGRCAAAPRCSDAPRRKDAPGVGAAMRLRVGAAVRPEPASLNLPNEPAQEEGAASRPPSRTGTRLPTDWQPTEADIAFAERQRQEVDWRTEADKFRDYWHGVAGAKGRKADWPATWRNWIRRAEPTRQARAAAPSRQAQGLASILGISAQAFLGSDSTQRGPRVIEGQFDRVLLPSTPERLDLKRT